MKRVLSKPAMHARMQFFAVVRAHAVQHCNAERMARSARQIEQRINETLLQIVQYATRHGLLALVAPRQAHDWVLRAAAMVRMLALRNEKLIDMAAFMLRDSAGLVMEMMEQYTFITPVARESVRCYICGVPDAEQVVYLLFADVTAARDNA